MRISVLGPLDVGGVTISAPKQRALVETLTVFRGSAVSTDRLAEVLWGDGRPKDPAGSIAFHVSKVRGLVGEDAIETAPPGYRLAAGVDTDLDEFERLVEQGRSLSTEEPEGAVEALDRALSLWRGDPLTDIEDSDLVRPEVQRLDELRVQAEEARAVALLALGRGGALVPQLERLVAAHPVRERPVALLMDALVAAGRPAEALTAYEACRGRLAEELGIEPGQALQARYDQVLGAAEGPTITGGLRNPYKGLRSFLEGDAADFFGRDDLVASILERVAGGERFLAAVGPSGSGKSSLLRAGIVASLRVGGIPGSESWPLAVLHPGAHPFEELEAALLRATGEPVAGILDVLSSGDRGLARAVKRLVPEGGRLVIVVDQFEELYRLPPADLRDRFEDLLAEAVEDEGLPLVVLIGLRADYYDRPLADQRLAPLVGEATVVVPPLDAADLERAISGPAGRVGVVVEPELEARIITEVLDRPGELPLLQYALTETFEHRGDHRVTVEDYEAVGGVRGALVATAERLFASLHDEARVELRSVLLGLVAVDPEGETRRRATLAEMGGIEAEPVLHALDDRRLITFDRHPATGEPTVEVAHESLFTAWPRYAGWIDERRDDLRMRHRLAVAARDWQEAGEDPGYLMAGSRLRQVQGWSETTDLTVGADERRFLEASIAAAEEARAAEALRDARERDLERRSRNRARIIAAVALVAIVIGVLAGFAWRQRNQAREAEADATAAEAAAVAAADTTDRVLEASQIAAASVSNLGVDPELSILLAYEAIRLTASVDGTVLPEASDAMHWALQEAHVTFPYVDPPAETRLSPRGVRGVFSIPIPDLLQLAAGSVSRGLTEEECRTYLRSSSCAAPSGSVYVGPYQELERSIATSDSFAATRVLVADPATENWPRYEAIGSRLGITIVPTTDQIPPPPILPGSEAEDVLDIVMVPQPGRLPDYVSHGSLIRLDAFIDHDDALRRYGSDIVGLGSVGPNGEWPDPDGSLYALMTKADLKSLIWYPKEAFAAAGYETPSTWAELEALVESIKAEQGTPWCAGNFSGGADGWPGTDWIEDLVLHTQGPEVYRAWAAGEIGFSDPRIVPAFVTYLEVVHGHGSYLDPGARLSETPWFVISPLLESPPGCHLARGAGFLPRVGLAIDYHVPEDAAPDDLGFFRFPSDVEYLSSAVMVGGQFVVALHDRPEVRAVVEALRSEQWHSMTTQDGYALVPDGSFDPDNYSLAHQREWAAILEEAIAGAGVVFDASDMMPEEIGSTTLSETSAFELGLFYRLMVDIGDDRSYYENRDLLMERLQEIDAAWAELRSASTP